METRLTLKLNESIIEKAKAYARSQNTSLSKMVEQYLSSVVTKNTTSVEAIEVSPRVKELSGVINLSQDYDYKKDYEDYLLHLKSSLPKIF